MSEIALTSEAAGDSPAPDDDAPKKPGLLGLSGWLAAIWLLFVSISSIVAPWLPLKDPARVDFSNPNQFPLKPIGTEGFLLGTDSNSFDIMSRLVWGGRVSLIVSLGVLAIGMLVGGTIGLLAGYFRGRTETLLMAAVDVFLAFPALILLIAIVAFLGSDLKNVVLGISLVSIPAFARIARATTLTYSQREFVTAAEAAGAGRARILVREVLPNVILPLLAFGLLVVGIAIVAEGSLAFLGLTSSETISWGGMINNGRNALQNDRIIHVAMLPALWMFLTVLSVNFLGDRFRAAFDVKDAAL